MNFFKGLFKKREQSQKTSKEEDPIKELEKLRRDNLKATRDRIKLLREQQIELQLQNEIEQMEEEMYGPAPEQEEETPAQDQLINSLLLKAFMGNSAHTSTGEQRKGMPAPLNTAISEATPINAPPTNSDALLNALNTVPAEKVGKLINLIEKL